MAEGEKSNKSIIIVIIIIIILGGAIGGYFLLQNNESTEVSNTNAAAANTTTQNTNTVGLEQYDGKLLEITSTGNKVAGVGKVVYQADKDNLLVYFHSFINDTLTLNGTCGSPAGGGDCQDMIRYEYHFKLLKGNNLKYGAYLYPILCNKDAYPADITQTPWSFYGSSACEVDDHVEALTESFMARGYIEFDSYDGILGAYNIEVVDSSPYWKTEEVDDGNGGTTTQYSLDSETALVQGSEVASYIIEIKEKL
ncbi:MAG: hypothetical protein V1853_04695 [bacterium]